MTKSRWSRLGRVPLAALGALTYLAIACAAAEFDWGPLGWRLGFH